MTVASPARICAWAALLGATTMACGDGAALDPRAGEDADSASQAETHDIGAAPADLDLGELAPDETAQPPTTVLTDTDAAADAAPDVTDAAPELPTWTPPEDPFDRGVVRIALTLEPLARSLLAQDPTSPVPARVAFDGAAPIDCRLALAGGERTFRGLDGKASFAVRFDAEVGNPHGLDGLTLDAMLDDASHLRTVAAHLVFRRLGLPAPRATHAQVLLDGEAFGLYAAVETLPSPAYLERATGTREGAIFAADRYTDFWPWQVPDLVLVRGAEAQRAALADLAERLEAFRIAGLDGAPIPLVDALGDRVALAPFLAAMGAELWLGHYGGYARGVRDYALHVAPDGSVTFLPVALGASLDPEDHPDPWWSSGRLLRHCLEDPACRPEWGKVLDGMVKHLDDVGILAELSALAFRARLELAADPRREVALVDVVAAQDALALALADRSAWIAGNLACTEPSDVDHDGDGVSACVDDCDDDDPAIHPGAPERCNLRDDDCDGVLDDDAACATCQVVADPTGADTAWELCYAPRDWVAARDDCRARGGDLVAVPDVAAHDALRRAALGLQWTSWWIGLSDRDAEGVYAWSDGTPRGAAAFTAWANGEPNDSGGNEDCAHLTSWSGGLWNDLDCGRALPYVCAQP